MYGLARLQYKALSGHLPVVNELVREKTDNPFQNINNGFQG